MDLVIQIVKNFSNMPWGFREVLGKLVTIKVFVTSKSYKFARLSWKFFLPDSINKSMIIK